MPLLSFEELAILLSLHSKYGVDRPALVFDAMGLYPSSRFDRHVALATIDKLIGLDLIAKDKPGLLYLTDAARQNIKETCLLTTKLVNRLRY